jgi:hypothetical protein
MIDFITQNWAILLQIVTGTITVASLIVKLTPTPNDDTILAKVISICRVVGLYK